MSVNQKLSISPVHLRHELRCTCLLLMIFYQAVVSNSYITIERLLTIALLKQNETTQTYLYEEPHVNVSDICFILLGVWHPKHLLISLGYALLIDHLVNIY